MKKRGQFYLVAALVIIVVIASLSVVYNETKLSDNNLVIYDLSNEIRFEFLQLLDSGYFNALTPIQLDDSINSIIESYSKTYPETNLVIIYGNNEKVNVIAYFTDTLGTIEIGEATYTIEERTFINQTLDVSNEGTIYFIINGTEYNFNIEEYGQNFYFVLKNEGQDKQIFVSTSKDACNSDDNCKNNEVCISGKCERCGRENDPCCRSSNEDYCRQGNLKCEGGICIKRNLND